MLSIHLDQRSGKPLYNQIYEQIREQILTGELTASTKLPSTRSMAGNLGVSRNTVDTAYYQLQSEGYIDAAPRADFMCVRSLRSITAQSQPSRCRRTLPEAQTQPVHPKHRTNLLFFTTLIPTRLISVIFRFLSGAVSPDRY